ncbi:M1 family metallopeptidase [Rhodothermus profundi]|uniref:Peptidase M1 membrane alanine aminopeptidase domain-containing protein n=1 Tax=Rhodothermus profundi TaxID=633813 RepID=A0A1M6PS70_9BACT|nr:M1 family metallopeptidase [Rhodothermus profundi]SHK10790.1 hypothetical protein SAMN04488087_0300 [Rhodothermus profundi]
MHPDAQTVRVSLIVFLAVTAPTFAQTSPDWQQQVHYEMDIRLDPEHHRLRGFAQIVYYNHSPDTLYHVFFHLYFNAFHPQSMMAERNRHLPDPDRRVVPRIWQLGPETRGFHRITHLAQEGQPLAFRITDTVLKAELIRPLAPGDSTVFTLRFHSQVPLQTRRSGRDNAEGIDFSMSQWYPKIAAYDGRGWHPDPYIGREFYGVFGTFDVRITLPACYTIAATGVLLNADEVGHGYDHITDQGWSRFDPREAGLRCTPGDSLTWHFRAENVHDFAWAADPDYIHETWRDDSLGVVYHLLFQPDVAARWQPMRQWVPWLIRYFSRRFGRYPYPQFTVVQAGDGGMEYPMINFITGRRSPLSLLGVTAHEAAHEWFYGVLASNENAYAWMDEGFTSWATTEAVAHLLGQEPDHRNAALSVVRLQQMGLFERLNTPADWFASNIAYSIASYPGGQMLLDLLGYVISDSLRDAFLQAYFRTYGLRHPNPYDVEKVAEQVSGMRLDWFFEQLTNTTYTYDDALDAVTQRPTSTGWQVTLRLRRRGAMFLPVDVRLTLANGTTQWVHIPLGLAQGHKPVPANWVVARPWLWTFPTYTLTLTLPARVVRAELDPLQRTPDHNRLNNTWPFPLRLDFLQPLAFDWTAYRASWRPLLTYAYDFGAGLGWQLRGRYFFDRHETLLTLKLWPLVLLSNGRRPERPGIQGRNAWWTGIDYVVRYSDRLGPRTRWHVQLEKHLGVMENRLLLTHTLGRWAALGHDYGSIELGLVHQYVPSNRAFTFERTLAWMPRNHLAWTRLAYRLERPRLHLTVALEMGEGQQGRGALRSMVDVSWHLTRPASFGVILHGTLARGSGQLPFSRVFRLGSASVETAWRHAGFRTIAALFNNARRSLHLIPLAVAGPVAYWSPELQDPLRLQGNVLVAGRVVAYGRPFTHALLRPLRFEGFLSIGQTWFTDPAQARDRYIFAWNRFLADAGVGLAYNLDELPGLTRWAAQSELLQHVRVHLRLPLWVSNPDLIGQRDALRFRWILGLEVKR